MVQDRHECYGRVNSQSSSYVRSASRPPNSSTRSWVSSVTSSAPARPLGAGAPWPEPRPARLRGRSARRRPGTSRRAPGPRRRGDHRGSRSAPYRLRAGRPLPPMAPPPSCSSRGVTRRSAPTSRRAPGSRSSGPAYRLKAPSLHQQPCRQRSTGALTDGRLIGPGAGREVIRPGVGEAGALAREAVADPQPAIGAERRAAAVSRHRTARRRPTICRQLSSAGVEGPQVVEERRSSLAGEDHQPHPGHPRRVMPEARGRPPRQRPPGIVGEVVGPQVGECARSRVATTTEQVRDLPVAVRGPRVVLARRWTGSGRGQLSRQPVGPIDGSTDGSSGRRGGSARRRRGARAVR